MGMEDAGRHFEDSICSSSKVLFFCFTSSVSGAFGKEIGNDPHNGAEALLCG